MSEAPNETVKRRKRENESKKWTDSEIKKVLAYMQTYTNIEKPTAHIYYENLIENTRIDATWNLLKCKVRHLKGTLQKANAWRSSTDAGVEDGNGSSAVKDKMLKICPHYDQLSDIFSTNKKIEVAAIDTSQLVELDYRTFAGTECNTFDTNDYEDDSLLLSDEAYTSPVANTRNIKINRSAHSTSVDKLAVMEAERVQFRRDQLNFEKEKFEWTKEFELKKLEMERKKQKDEFELKKLQLEQNERLKMFEIEMKYKSNK